MPACTWQIVTTDKPAALFSLSGAEGNQMLRAWNLHSGALVWDRVLCDEAEGAPQQPPVNGGLLQMGPDQTTALGRSLIFVTACGQMQVRPGPVLPCLTRRKAGPATLVVSSSSA